MRGTPSIGLSSIPFLVAQLVMISSLPFLVAHPRDITTRSLGA